MVNKESRLAIVLLGPSLLALLALIGWPVAYSFFLSLHRVIIAGGRMGFKYIGARNYLGLFADARFRQTLGQTVIFTVISVAAVMVISLVLAIILNQAFFGVGLFKRLFLLPWALSWVVNALMWGWIFHGSFGVANAILLRLGLIKDYVVWLAEPTKAMLVIIFASVWKAVPFAALMTLAALKTVPEEPMDAAKVDGAGVWARFYHITLPWIRPVLLVLLVIETMWALKTFDIIWVLTEGGPMDKTMVLNVLTYQTAFRFFKLGSASALGYLITAFTLILTVIYLRLLHGFEEAY